MEHITHLVNLNPTRKTYLYFSDDVIAVPWLARMAERILKEGLGERIRWICDARLDKGFTPQVCSNLYRAGCREIFFGIESGVQRVLDLIGKGTRLDVMSDAIKNVGRAGIGVYLSLIVGFPGEEEREAFATLDFVLAHAPYIYTAQFGPFVVVKDSPIWKDSARWGVTFDRERLLDLQLTLTTEFSVSQGMAYRESYRRAEIIRRRFYRAKPTLYVDLPGFEASFDARSLLYLDRFGTDGIERMLTASTDAVAV